MEHKSQSLSLAPQGVFWTLQGEGAQLGEPMCFIRLAGCSVGCVGCDTNYLFAETVSVEDIIARVRAVVPPVFSQRRRDGQMWAQPWVWITGGEPTDQDIHPLIDALRTLGYRVALATAGIRVVPVDTLKLVNWLSVSPHSADKLVQWHGHEVKLVPGLGQLTWDNLPLRECGSFAWKYLQPRPGREEQETGIAWVQEHPGWRLSPQAHKYWRIA